MVERTTPAIMVQGTGSNVGKSILVAGLCRAFMRRGMSVCPFKPQNMSNNAAAVEGGEIGRAQALQARAAGISPNAHMNPVLLKPESDRRSQVIVQGVRAGYMEASGFREQRGSLLPAVLDSFQRVGAGADIVVVEGAGSPAETNLRQGDIANMGFAATARVPVVLAGDIDRGGVIASLVGTNTVLDDVDRALVKGFLINKFRGDAGLFKDGMTTIESMTGWAPLGIVPWFADAHRLPAEDAVDLSISRRKRDALIIIAVPMLSRIANFDDLDPLKLEPSVQLIMVPPGMPLPGNADLILLPGTKATIADLLFLRQQGWDVDLMAHRRRGGRIFGICGGYQMLGEAIRDPAGHEGAVKYCEGLRFLDITTEISGEKTVRPVEAQHIASGLPVRGYEIHLGETTGPDTKRGPFLREGVIEGACSADGIVAGTYLHGLFSNDAFRQGFLTEIAGGSFASGISYEPLVERTLDDLAMHLELHLDIDAILQIARKGV